jgi:hypothetical protein
MAGDFIAMSNGELDVAESVIRERKLEIWIAMPGGAQFLIVAAVRQPGTIGLPQVFRHW